MCWARVKLRHDMVCCSALGVEFCWSELAFGRCVSVVGGFDACSGGFPWCVWVLVGRTQQVLASVFGCVG